MTQSAVRVLTLQLHCKEICRIALFRRDRNFVRGGSTNSVEDRGQRERGSGDGSQLVSGSGGSCNLVKDISLLIVKFS